MSIFIFISEVVWKVLHRAPNDLLDNKAECCVGNLNCVSTSVLFNARQLHADKQTNKQVKFLKKVTICMKLIRMNVVWMVIDSSNDHIHSSQSDLTTAGHHMRM